MRQLWRDIDDSKQKAGFADPAMPATSAAGWDVGAVLGRACALVGEVAAWVSASVPTVCATIASGAELLRAVPLVGRLVELAPGARSTDAPTAPVDAVPPDRANGSARPRGGAPDGEWLH